MSDTKFQQIRVRINTPKQSVRINAEADKNYGKVKGIHVSLPQDVHHFGSQLGLKIGQKELFTDQHETRLLSCGNQVAPNQKFFLLEEEILAEGNTIEGKFTDGGNAALYPYEAIIYLWLTGEINQP